MNMSNIILNDFTDTIILNVNGVQLNECFSDETVHEIMTKTSSEIGTSENFEEVIPLVHHHHHQNHHHEQEQQQIQHNDQHQQQQQQSVEQQYNSIVIEKAERGIEQIHFIHNNENDNELQNNKISTDVAIHTDIFNEKLQKICRCCLTQTQQGNEMKSIFDENDCIVTMIGLLVGLELTPDDGLPGNICVDCLDQLTKYINFRQQIEMADMTLRHCITQGFHQGMSLDKIDIEQIANRIEEMNENDFNDLEENTSSSTSNIENIVTTIITECANNEDISTTNSNFYVKGTDSIVTNLHDVTTISTRTPDVSSQSSSSSSQNKTFPSSNTTISLFQKVSEEKICDENSQKLPQNDYCIEMNPDMPERYQIEEEEILNEPTPIIDIDDHEIENERMEFNCENDSTASEKNSEENINDEFTCEKCEKTYKDYKTYYRHIESHSKLYFCDYCKQSFRYRSALRNHLQCHKDSKSNKLLKNMNNDKDLNEELKCKMCNAIFSLEVDLFVHGSLHDSEDRFVCRKCGKEFPAFIKLKRHLPTHYEDKPHKCEICGMGFPEIASLTRHFRKHAGTSRERKFSCDQCDKKYYDSHSLMIHRRTHTGEKPWKCEFCSKAFIDSRLLNSHLRTHSSEKTYECDICSRKFTHASTLKTHIRIHTGEKPYICGVCDKTFVQASNLNLHMRVHTGERPYQCKLCPMSFASSSTLSSHIQTHSDEKPYHCPTCNKSLSRRHINVHMRIHLGEKPYECKNCSKKFRTNGQLNQHRKRIHLHSQKSDSNDFICKLCDETFTSNNALKKHMNLIHEQQQEEGNEQEQEHEQIENDDDEDDDDYEISTKMKKLKNEIKRIKEQQDLMENNDNDAGDHDDDSSYNESVLLVNDLLAAVTDNPTGNSYNSDTEKNKNSFDIVETQITSNLNEFNCTNENDCDMMDLVNPVNVRKTDNQK